MKKQKKSRCEQLKNHNKTSKKQDGITLIALVISIIVMLILAGVSINAIVGENGVLTKAQKATIDNKKASILEAIDLELASYNIDTILNNPEETSAMLTGLKAKNVIDTVLSSSGQTADVTQALAIPQFDDSNNYTGYTDYGVMKDDYSIILSVDMNGIYKAQFGEVTISSGGSVAAGTTVVTGNTFNSGSGTENPEDQGKFTIDNDASVMFVDEINGELSIQVKSDTHAKVNIFKDMTLTNTGVSRSAIDIEPGGILDMYIADGVEVTVNSGIGATAPMNTGSGAAGGHGGYAGIHVPENATLNIYGNGKLYSQGGNASDGGSAVANNAGGGGGGGAGAGIGGNGGNGGDSNGALRYTDKFSWSAKDGADGENCGNINIYGKIIVYAYGGAGGSGGLYSDETGSSGTGGSGYPAAGIGGGGAGGGGGDHMNAGGGYSGGVSEFISSGTKIVNGVSNIEPEIYAAHGNGGSYYSRANYEKKNTNIAGAIGGQGGNDHSANDFWFLDSGGDGGIAGKGGNVSVSVDSTIFAYNGDMVTNGEYDNIYEYDKDGNILKKLTAINKIGELDNKGIIIPTIIYAQNGILRNVYKINAWWGHKPKTNYDFYYSLFGETINQSASSIRIPRDNIDWSGIDKNEYLDSVENCLIRVETTCDILKDEKGNSIGQGIGSGAGYIELSNGTYTVDSSMN